MKALAQLYQSYKKGEAAGLYRRWLVYKDLDPMVGVVQGHLDALPDDAARDRGLARAMLSIMNYGQDSGDVAPSCLAAGVLPWSLHQQLDELEQWVKAHYGKIDDEWRFVPRYDDPMPPLLLLGQILSAIGQHYQIDQAGWWVTASSRFADEFIKVWPIACLWLNGWLEQKTELAGGLLDFSTTWCRAGYSQLVVHQPLAAAFALTDVPENLIPTELPWKAFRILMPKSPVVMSGPDFEGRFDELWVWQTQLLEEEGLWALGGRAEWTTLSTGKTRRDWCIITSYPTTLQHLAKTVKERLNQISMSGERSQLLTQGSEAARALVNILLCVSIQLHERNFERAPVKKPPKGKRWRAPKQAPLTTDYVLGRDIRVTGPNLAPVVESICRGEKKYGVKQWMVRGHKREQAHGPKHSLRKTIWIQPFWKGPVDAPILKRSHELEDTHAD